MAALLVLAGCETLQFAPARLATDISTEAPPPPLELAWTYNAGAAFGPSALVLMGDLALVSTRQGEIHAIDLERGKKRGLRSFGDVLEGRIATQRQTLFVPVASGKYALVAFDLSDGRERWSVKGDPVVGGVALASGNAIVGDLGGTVRAYETVRGAEAWATDLPGTPGVHVAPVALGDDAVLVAGGDGFVTLLDAATGAIRWHTDASAPIYAMPAVSEIGPTEPLAIIPTTRGRLVALSSNDGTERWRYAVPDTTVRFATPAIAGRLILAPTSGGSVYAIDHVTGALAWTYHADDVFTAEPLVDNERVYLGTQRGHIIVLTTGGEEIARYDVRGRVKSTVQAAGGGLLVLSEPRHVTYFTRADELLAAPTAAAR